ncbi:hypothetical protein DUN34_08340 [Escherichia coli]|nr:hypothetical protein [Escherichia coli]
MKKVFAKSLLVAAMFSVAGSALAVQKDITVTANVDAALDMTQTDNTALPKAVEMQYLPGQGLQSYQLMTKIWSNDVTKDVKMQLVSPAQLVQSLDASKIVPLTVTWGGEEIKADAATTFTATKIFASDALTNGSLAKNLMFAQTTKGVLETGTVSDSYDRKNHDHLSAFTGTYSSTLAVSRYGVNLGASGTDDLLGAVLVDVKGFSEQDEESQDLQLEARVAGSRTLQLGQSDSVLFPYPGFQSGFVEVNDSSQGNQQGTTNIINGAGNRELMLLPGKLRYREVSASFNYNYIGRLLLPASVEKFPLVGLNSAMLLVAEDGGFTLEINGSEKELYLLSGQQFLKCPLSVVKKRASIRYSGDVTCSVVTYSQLPESIQVQAQLKQPKLRGNVQTAQREVAP